MISWTHSKAKSVKHNGTCSKDDRKIVFKITHPPSANRYGSIAFSL
jgi:hypothetical protein